MESSGGETFCNLPPSDREGKRHLSSGRQRERIIKKRQSFFVQKTQHQSRDSAFRKSYNNLQGGLPCFPVTQWEAVQKTLTHSIRYIISKAQQGRKLGQVRVRVLTERKMSNIYYKY